MKKVNFILYSGQEKAYDFEVEYTLEDDYVCFSHMEYDYKIKINDEEVAEFQRESEEDKLVLKSDRVGLVHLKNLDKAFEIGILDFKYTKDDQVWVIQYELESDKGVLKTIELHFVS